MILILAYRNAIAHPGLGLRVAPRHDQ